MMKAAMTFGPCRLADLITIEITTNHTLSPRNNFTGSCLRTWDGFTGHCVHWCNRQICKSPLRAEGYAVS